MTPLNKILIQKGQQLLKKSTPLSLILINRLLPQIVPFNQAHNISIVKMDSQKTYTFLPFKRSNKNHVSTMHACAIATLGEFSAGIMLMREIPLYKYRMVLKELSTDYHFQAKQSLTGIATLPAGFDQEKETLKKNGTLTIPLVTEIFDQEKRLVATTTSLWHLKRWSLTHTGRP
jgi:acyl-coenzyme A thioesterase PaaI-like protein